MGKCDVLLPLWRLFWALQARDVARDAGRKNGAAWTDDSMGVVGNLTHDGDPEHHGFPVAGVKTEPESLDEHHLWRDLYGDYSVHDVGLGILHILRNR